MLNSEDKCKIVYDRGAWGTHGYTSGGVRSPKKVYLELRKVLDELGIGFRILRINLVNPTSNYKESYTSICYEDITEEKIDGELKRLTKYQEIN